MLSKEVSLKTFKVTYSIYIGVPSDIINAINSLIESNQLISRSRSKSKAELKLSLETDITTSFGVVNRSFCKIDVFKSKHFIIMINSDKLMEHDSGLSSKDMIRRLKFTYNHEIRYLVDLICLDRRLDLNDLELTANLSADIYDECDPVFDDYLESLKLT